MAFDIIHGERTPTDWSCGIGDAGDPLVWTPSTIRSELARVRGVLDTANAEVSAAEKQRRISRDEWKRWRSFYVGAHKFTNEASSLWGASVSHARQLEAEAIRWRELVAKRGGPVVGPASVRTEPLNLWKWGAVAAAGAVAAGLVARKLGA